MNFCQLSFLSGPGITNCSLSPNRIMDDSVLWYLLKIMIKWRLDACLVNKKTKISRKAVPPPHLTQTQIELVPPHFQIGRAAAFSRSWLRTRLVKSALLPLPWDHVVSNTFSAGCSWALPYLFHFPRNIRRKSFPFSYSFFRLYIQELKVLYITFTRSLVHVVLGTKLLQRPFFRGGNFTSLNNFFIWTLSGSL